MIPVLRALIVVTFAFLVGFEVPSVRPAEIGDKSLVDIITIYQRRTKRGLDYQDSGFDMEIKAFDTTHKLKLRSTESLFSDNFQFHDLDMDENGNIVPTERTPSKREIQAIENHIYVDSDANAVLKIRNIDGEFHLDGLINNMRISRDADNSTNEATVVEQDFRKDESSRNRSDYVDLERPVATPRALSSGKIAISPEIAFVMDYGNSKLFNFDNVKMVDYLAVMLNSVNNRYATLQDPQITFKLSGVFSIKSPAGQPFLENSKQGGMVNIDKLLDSYKYWIFANLKDFPKHDLIPLLFSDPPSSGFVGLAYVKGACWVQPQTKSVMATSVSHDLGGTWKGSLTLTHELGHNLGSPHDGDASSRSCAWSLGYIMSYEGYGTMNKFTFSHCSSEVMKEFIQSTGGACLFTQDNKSPQKATHDNIGDRLSMIQMCQKRTGFANATVLKDKPDEQCMELACKITFVTKVGPMTRTRWQSQTYGELPGDNSPCGTANGRCKNGKCVVAG